MKQTECMSGAGIDQLVVDWAGYSAGCSIVGSALFGAVWFLLLFL